MWAVYKGIRPPLIRDCPQPIEDLIVRCWDQNPQNRLSMEEVVQRMRVLCSFLAQDLEPVTYDDAEGEYEEYEEFEGEEYVDPFEGTLGTNGESRRISLPQPNGEVGKPLRLEIGQVGIFILKSEHEITQNQILK